MTKIIDKKSWYFKAKKRWQDTEATKNGVLGGFEYVHGVDTANSCELLQHLIDNKIIATNAAIDCAAGIGRISESVLTKFFEKTDILEQDEKFVAKCRENFKNNDKIGKIYQNSLQNFDFEKKYDVIWIQWCLEDLELDGLLRFLTNCKNALSENGVLIIKDNIVNDDQETWLQEFSEIRSNKVYHEIFKNCGFEILMNYHQPNWPKDLLAVSVFVLK